MIRRNTLMEYWDRRNFEQTPEPSPGGGGRVMRQLAGTLRRFYLVHWRKEYVRRQLRLRRGECRQCAICCSLLLTCHMLTPANRCRGYSGRRWLVCKVFPIDRRDLEDVAVAGGRCGYYFVSDPATSR